MSRIHTWDGLLDSELIVTGAILRKLLDKAEDKPVVLALIRRGDAGRPFRDGGFVVSSFFHLADYGKLVGGRLGALQYRSSSRVPVFDYEGASPLRPLRAARLGLDGNHRHDGIVTVRVEDLWKTSTFFNPAKPRLVSSR